MAPRVKVMRDEILAAAVEVVREGGAESLNARTVAAALGCSTQPVFSNFATMQELRLAVVRQADLLCNEYIQKEIERGEFPAYKASGMAYIRFAKEERELFQLLYMRDRREEASDEISVTEKPMETIVHRQTGLLGDAGKRFHLEMWAYVHGIAAMVATGFLELDRDLVSQMLTDAYQGLRKQYGLEGSPWMPSASKD